MLTLRCWYRKRGRLVLVLVPVPVVADKLGQVPIVIFLAFSMAKGNVDLKDVK